MAPAPPKTLPSRRLFGVLDISESAELEGQEQRARGGERPGQEVEFDETAHLLDKTNDPVPLYLREMGACRCSSARAEWRSPSADASRACVKTISRSPLVLELIVIGGELRDGFRSIGEVVQFDEEELTEEIMESRTRQTLRIIHNRLRCRAQASGWLARSQMEACLPARVVVTHAHPDVAARSLHRFPPAREEAPD